MEDYRTIEGVTALFKSVDGISAQNNIFLAFKNTNRDAMKAGIAGGLAGGMAAAGLTAVVLNTKKRRRMFLRVNLPRF